MSRCRAHVAVVAGLPDFQLTIWDWLEEKQVAAYSAGQAFTGRSALLLVSLIVSCGCQAMHLCVTCLHSTASRTIQ